jgi:bifunctional DNA-binding transcriptional regulator/antitoxin component of YhaV-PrlF toxin-antitoxin module
MSGTYTATVGERGRIVVPAEGRANACLDEGTVPILRDTPEGLVKFTRAQLATRVRVDLAGLDLAGELLAERRADAAREDAR